MSMSSDVVEFCRDVVQLSQLSGPVTLPTKKGACSQHVVCKKTKSYYVK
jgi:hypothetical protein